MSFACCRPWIFQLARQILLTLFVMPNIEEGIRVIFLYFCVRLSPDVMPRMISCHPFLVEVVVNHGPYLFQEKKVMILITQPMCLRSSHLCHHPERGSWRGVSQDMQGPRTWRRNVSLHRQAQLHSAQMYSMWRMGASWKTLTKVCLMIAPYLLY